MLDLISKGVKGNNTVYLWRLGNYKYEIETTRALGNGKMTFTASFEDALAKFETMVDKTTIGPLTVKDFS